MGKLDSLRFCILFLMTMSSCTGGPGPLPDPVRKGLADLRSLDLSAQEVPLSGEWQFAPGLKGPSGALASWAPLPVSMRFGKEGYTPEGAVYGAGTYRLKLLLPPESRALALKFPYIGIAHRIYLQDELVSEMGKVSESREGEIPSYSPFLLDIPGGIGSELNLTVEFSNWSDVIAGMVDPVVIGPRLFLAGDRDRSLIADSLLVGALGLMGLYHFGFFAYRRKDRSPLFFGLLCLSVALRTACIDEMILLRIWPGLDWQNFIRIFYSATFSAPVFYLAFLQEVFPGKLGRWSVRILAALTGLYGILVLTLPVAYFTQGLWVMNLLLVGAGACGILQVFLAPRDRREGRELFLSGAAFLLAGVVNDVLKVSLILPTPNLAAFGLLAFLTAQALLLTKVFTRAYALSENYAHHLLRLNSSLERFIPREVLKFLKKDSILDIALGDFSQEKMTVFFLDIRNFTALSETLSPKANFDFINHFLLRFGPLVRHHQGFIDKYVGDGIIALFPTHPRQALEAAMDMRHELVSWNQDQQRQGLPPIAFGIGMHYGDLMIGTIGENQRMDSTVISDAVNVASRLENLTKVYKVDILLSGPTYEVLQESHGEKLIWLAEEKLRGRTGTLAVYTVKTED